MCLPIWGIQLRESTTSIVSRDGNRWMRSPFRRVSFVRGRTAGIWKCYLKWIPENLSIRVFPSYVGFNIQLTIGLESATTWPSCACREKSPSTLSRNACASTATQRFQPLAHWWVWLFLTPIMQNMCGRNRTMVYQRIEDLTWTSPSFSPLPCWQKQGTGKSTIKKKHAAPEGRLTLREENESCSFSRSLI